MQMRVRSFEPLTRKIVQVLMIFFAQSVQGDQLVRASLRIFANMAILVTYASATRLLLLHHYQLEISRSMTKPA